VCEGFKEAFSKSLSITSGRTVGEVEGNAVSKTLKQHYTHTVMILG